MRYRTAKKQLNRIGHAHARILDAEVAGKYARALRKAKRAGALGEKVPEKHLERYHCVIAQRLNA